MPTTATRDHIQRLVQTLLSEAERTESLSRRNGWDTENQSSAYPGGELVDSLLDIRAATSSDDTRVTEIVDGALAEYGHRPGACTTAEVRALCSSLLEAITDTGAIT